MKKNKIKRRLPIFWNNEPASERRAQNTLYWHPSRARSFAQQLCKAQGLTARAQDPDPVPVLPECFLPDHSLLPLDRRLHLVSCQQHGSHPGPVSLHSGLSPFRCCDCCHSRGNKPREKAPFHRRPRCQEQGCKGSAGGRRRQPPAQTNAAGASTSLSDGPARQKTHCRAGTSLWPGARGGTRAHTGPGPPSASETGGGTRPAAARPHPREEARGRRHHGDRAARTVGYPTSPSRWLPAPEAYL